MIIDIITPKDSCFDLEVFFSALDQFEFVVELVMKMIREGEQLGETLFEGMKF